MKRSELVAEREGHRLRVELHVLALAGRERYFGLEPGLADVGVDEPARVERDGGADLQRGRELVLDLEGGRRAADVAQRIGIGTARKVPSRRLRWMVIPKTFLLVVVSMSCLSVVVEDVGRRLKMM